MIKISIIIPFYNTPKEFFSRCLESVFLQTYKNLEVILINDGSDNNYSEILNQYPNFRVLNCNHQGVSACRNEGIKNSSGEYLLFVDSDDFLPVDACEIFSSLIQKKDFDIIISKCNIFSKTETKMNYSFYEQPFVIEDKQELLDSIFLDKDCKFTCVDTPWAKLYKKEFLLKNGLFFKENLKNGEDGIFNYEAYYLSDNILFYPKSVYNYRVNEHSVCNTFYNDLDERFIELKREYQNLFEKYQIKDKNFDYFQLRIIHRLLRKYYTKLNYNTYKNSIKKIIDEFNCKTLIINTNILNKNQKILLKLLKKNKIFIIYLMLKIGRFNNKK